MAGFHSHSKCAHYRDKRLGNDPCVQKKECDICRGFTPEQNLQLATPTYRDRKEKKTATTTTSTTPTLVDPAHVSVLGKVEKFKAVQSTPAKKTKRSESPKPSASKNSNSNSNSTFIALNLCQKTDSKAHHTKTLFNIQKPETLQGSAPRRKQKGNWKFRVGMLFQRGMTSTLT